MHPQTNSVILEVNGDEDSMLYININGQLRALTIKELLEMGYSSHMKPYHSHAYKVHTAIGESKYNVSKTVRDSADKGKAIYHMEVIQQNGSCAFVSPVFFEP